MILIIVPSRGRPHNAFELKESWETFTEGKSDLLFLVDSDDPTAGEYPYGSIVGEPGKLVSLTNRAALENLDKYEIFGSIGDDHRFESLWESDLLKFEAPAILYGDDGFHGPNLSTAFFMTNDIVKELGYMIYPELEHLYADNFAMELGRAAECLYYLPHIKITHYHPAAKKAKWDETYERGNNPGVWDHDGKIYVNWMNNIRPIQADRIKALKGNKWEK